MDSRVLTIRKHLKKKLDPMRYEHTLGVAFTCQALAMRYGYDLDKAELAGLLHDCAKRYDGPTLLKKCLDRGIEVSESEATDPSLLHAKLGAWMAGEKYGVDDPEIASAIACHTTGKPGMTLLDKILYVADYIEPRRDKAKNLPAMRKLAFEDLDLVCFSIMESSLEYLKAKNCPVDPMTAIACEDIRRIVSERQTGEEQSPENAALAVPAGEDCGQGTLKKEVLTVGTVKGNGKARSRSIGREKRRRHKNHRH